MSEKKKNRFPQKNSLHPRNKYKGLYDFDALLKVNPELHHFVKKNEYGDASINFFDPVAVKMLNKALLQFDYDIQFWDIPNGYLCPPIPGRADYIHFIADLLKSSFLNVNQAVNNKITCLDVGVGANCIYPIIGVQEYDWNFIASDIDPVALRNAQQIVESNPSLKGRVNLRLQQDARNAFNGIVANDDRIEIVICNPPFHFSAKEAVEGSLRKLTNLKQERADKPVLNFGGQSNELWCNGGEERFIRNMIFESKAFEKNCCWFTSLVAKKEHLKRIYNAIEKVQATEVQTIEMAQGNKMSRIVAWTYWNKQEQAEWIQKKGSKNY